MKVLLFLSLILSAGAYAQDSQCVKDFNLGLEAYNRSIVSHNEAVQLLEKANTAKTKAEVCKFAGEASYLLTLEVKTLETAKDQFLAAIVSCAQQNQRVRVQSTLRSTIDKYVDALFANDSLLGQLENYACD